MVRIEDTWSWWCVFCFEYFLNVAHFEFISIRLSYLSAALSQASGVSTAGKFSVVKSIAFRTTDSFPSFPERQRPCAIVVAIEVVDDVDDTESLCILFQAKSRSPPNVHLSPNATVFPLLVEWLYSSV